MLFTPIRPRFLFHTHSIIGLSSPGFTLSGHQTIFKPQQLTSNRVAHHTSMNAAKKAKLSELRRFITYGTGGLDIMFALSNRIPQVLWGDAEAGPRWILHTQ